MNLKTRLLIIAGLLVVSVWALFPREVTERVRRDGVFVDTTVTRFPLKKGLDLEGGMHLSLEIDESRGAVANKPEAIDRALTVIRTRIDEFGVSEPNVQKVGEDRIVVELPGIEDPDRAIDVVQKSAFLQFQITDETNALQRVMPRLDGIIRDLGLAQATEAPADWPARTGIEGLLDDSAAVAGDTATGDTLPSLLGTTDGPLSSLLQQGQVPGEYYVAADAVPRVMRYLAAPQVAAALPPGKVLRWMNDSLSLGGNWYRPLYVLDARPIITGEYLTDAQPGTDPRDGTIVTFEFNNEGGRRFRRETERHIQDYMAIVLDDRVMGQPPVIQSAIGSRGQITMGGRDLQAAQDLALVLRAGSLPAPLKVMEARNIGASLGADAIAAGVRAGIVAVALVVLIMIGYYRFSGFLAVVGLAFYALTTLAILAGFNAVLTLPGIAGFVLSIGMAVDANFLIFERIREELDKGKTVRTAINEGFDHAWSAIVDTHVTTALTAAILYQFGTGPVQGFAVALLAGLTASLVSAIFVVRTLFLVWLHRTRANQPLSI